MFTKTLWFTLWKPDKGRVIRRKCERAESDCFRQNELKASMRVRFSRKKKFFLNWEVSEYKYRGKYEYKRSSLRCKHKYFSTRILLY